MRTDRGVSGSTIYYGWWIVVVMFCTLISTAGNGFYAFSVYVPRLIDEFACSTSSLMLAAATWAVVFGFSNPLVGVLIHKYGVRKTVISGVICAGILMVALSFITQLWHIYVLNVISGFVGAATILVPSQTLVVQWFKRRRGIAMAVVMMGIGVGGFIIQQVAAWLIHEFGWINSFRIAAVFNYLLVLPPLVFFLRDKPSDVGECIDGIPAERDDSSAAQESEGISAVQAVRIPAFWFLFGIYLLQLFVMSGIQLNIQNFAEKQMGYSLFMATRFMAFALFVTLPARFIFGWLCDRFNPRYLMSAASFSLMGGSFMLWLCVIKLGWVNDYRAILLFALFQGFGIAGSTVVLPILVGRYFGEREFARIMGLVMGGFALGVIFGPFLMGLIFDLARDYAGAFVLAMIISACAGFLALCVRIR